MQLKYGETSTIQLCQYNTLAQIVSAALGGSSDSNEEDITKGKSLETAVADINAMLRF